MNSSRWLGAALAITLALAVLGLGSVTPGWRTVAHLACAVCASAALGLSDRRLAGAGAAVPLLIATALLGGALAIGLVPVAPSVGAVISPGAATAHASTGWRTVAVQPEPVATELTKLFLAGGFVFVVAVWGAASHSRRRVERFLSIAAIGLGAVALAHAATGAQTLFGLVPVDTSPKPFFAPLVNGNHLAALLLLALPVLVSRSLSAEEPLPWRAIAVLGVVLTAACLAWIRSTGASVAAAAALLLLVARLRPPAIGRWVLVAASAAALAVPLLTETTPESTLRGRWELWRDALRMLTDFPVVGVGGGGFGLVVQAYRHDDAWLTFTHAHSDPLEWLVETGLIGLVALAGALWVAWPRRASEHPERATALSLGLVALATHSLVEFPLQIPGVAMAAGGVLAVRSAVFASRVDVRPALIRGLLVGVGLAQVGAAGWEVRTGVADRATSAARSSDDVGGQVAALRGAAPWRAELAMAEARERLNAGDRSGAIALGLHVLVRHAHDPSALRGAGKLFADADQLDLATVALRRAAERAPRDQRTWAALARLAAARGNIPDALEAWDRALDLTGPQASVKQAWAFLPLGPHWLDALADAPAQRSVELGVYALEDGDVETAVLAWDQAIRLDPSHAEDPRRAVALHAAGRPDAAYALLDELLAGKTARAETLAVKGDLLARDGRHAEAADAFLRGARAGKPALKHRAVIATEIGRGSDAALELIRRFDLEGGTGAAIGMEAARIRRDQRDGEGCVHEIDRRKLTEDPVYGERAVRLRAMCLQTRR